MTLSTGLPAGTMTRIRRGCSSMTIRFGGTVGGGDRLALRRTVHERLRLGRVEVVADDRKPAALDVAREVRAHHAEPDDSHCVLHDVTSGASGGLPTRNSNSPARGTL